MKNSKFILFLCIPLVLLSSCASYRASGLETISSGGSVYSLQGENITIAAKVFSRADCKRYLDRNTIAKGYQPV
jgi:phage gp45-like